MITHEINNTLDNSIINLDQSDTINTRHEDLLEYE